MLDFRILPSGFALLFLGIASAQDIPVLPGEVCQAVGACAEPVSPTGELSATGHRGTFPGSDGNPGFGAEPAFRDNGDGTISDLNTGLMWAKAIELDGVGSATNLHDADNLYPWFGRCTRRVRDCGTHSQCPVGETCDAFDPQGTSLTIFGVVQILNATRFAGYDDWRVPNVRELESIVRYGGSVPAVEPAFHGAGCGTGCTDMSDPDCSCTSTDTYWSSTSVRGRIFGVDLLRARVFSRDRRIKNYPSGALRPVRGGAVTSRGES